MATKKPAATSPPVDDRTSDSPVYVEIKISRMIEVDGHKYRPGAKIKVLESEVSKFSGAIDG